MPLTSIFVFFLLIFNSLFQIRNHCHSFKIHLRKGKPFLDKNMFFYMHNQSALQKKAHNKMQILCKCALTCTIVVHILRVLHKKAELLCIFIRSIKYHKERYFCIKLLFQLVQRPKCRFLQVF